MAVKVNDRDGAVRPVDGPQQGKGDGVVTAERDDTRQGLALDCGAPLVRICRGRAGEDLEVALLDLPKSPSVVVSSRLSVLGLRRGKCLSLRLTR